MYECFHCLTRTVVWDADFSFEDYGIENDVLDIIGQMPSRDLEGVKKDADEV